MTWGATSAKAKFSEMLDKAENEGPQLVRRRKREFFVITREQMESLSESIIPSQKRRGRGVEQPMNLVEFFRNSPLAKEGIELKRIKLKPRHVDF